jgi:maleamate amidohydrolase
MTNNSWELFIPPSDLEIYEAAGYGARSPWGKRPAVLVVDVNYNFVGDKREPILDSIRKFRNSCGEAGWDAVDAISTLLDASRRAGLPTFYTTQHANASTQQVGGWAKKNSRVEDDADHASFGVQIPTEIAPVEGELVIAKDKASAFFGTSLVSYLTFHSIDTVLVVGGTTSGCVRATVIDAFSYNYSVVVVEEGCFDRAAISQAVNLFEINAKYADVAPLEDVLTYVDGLSTQAAG